MFDTDHTITLQLLLTAYNFYSHHISRKQAFFNVRKFNPVIYTWVSTDKRTTFDSLLYIGNKNSKLYSPCVVFSHVCASVKLVPVSTALISIRRIFVALHRSKVWFINGRINVQGTEATNSNFTARFCQTRSLVWCHALRARHPACVVLWPISESYLNNSLCANCCLPYGAFLTLISVLYYVLFNEIAFDYFVCLLDISHDKPPDTGQINRVNLKIVMLKSFILETC